MAKKKVDGAALIGKPAPADDGDCHVASCYCLRAPDDKCILTLHVDDDGDACIASTDSAGNVRHTKVKLLLDLAHPVT